MPTGIPYLHETANPTTGCSKISEGCANCYALKNAWRFRNHPNPKISGRYVDTVEQNGNGPEWTSIVHMVAGEMGKRRGKGKRIGVGFNADLFHENVPLDYIAGCFLGAIRDPDNTYFFLTKRPGRMVEAVRLLEDRYGVDLWKSPHLWFGVTIESAKYMHRLKTLLSIEVPFRWVSFEPLLGPIPKVDFGGIHWIVAGGESGKLARPTHPDWVRGLRQACIFEHIPFYFKQWGEWGPIAPQYQDTDTFVKGDRVEELQEGLLGENLHRPYVCLQRNGFVPISPGHCDYQPIPRLNPWLIVKVGKKNAGRTLDGEIWEQVPEAI